MTNKKNIKNKQKNKSEIELVKKKNNKMSEINDKIQSTVSVFYTIIIFVMIIILLFVVYNQFLKKKEKINIEKVCSDYIKKNYDIKENDIINYIRDNRHIIYNIDTFNIKNINSETINNFTKYIIWNNETDYTLCENDDE